MSLRSILSGVGCVRLHFLLYIEARCVVKDSLNDTMAQHEKVCACNLLATIACSILENQGFSAIQTLISITQEIIGSTRSQTISKEKPLEFQYSEGFFLLFTNLSHIIPEWQNKQFEKT